MLSKLNKGKVTMIVIGFVALVLTGTIVTSTIVGIKAANGNPIPNYTTKDTSKALGTNENPYTILEIVPDVNSATVGYLINGCEPNNLLSIGATDSAAEIYAGAFDVDGSHSSTVAPDKSDTYIYEQDKASIGTTPSSRFTEKHDTYAGQGQPGTDMAYSEFGYFTRVTNGTGMYNYDTSKKCFVPANGGNFSWTSVGEFRYVGTGNVPSGSIPCTRALDYGLDVNRRFSYDYSSKSGAVGSEAYNYYYTPSGDFVWVPNNNYNNENVFAENQTEISYVENKEIKTRTISGAVIGDKFYMTRTENEYYVYQARSITVNDLLLEELVGSGTSGLNYKTQVVTVTPAQLVVDDSGSGEDAKAKDLIDTADAIIIHDSETGYNISNALNNRIGTAPNFDKNTSKDLTTETVNYMIRRGATAKPAAIIFDEEAIKTANSYVNSYGNPDDTKNCPNLKLVYDVYNNLGAKLAYNWMSGQSYASKLTAASQDAEHYRNFGFEEKDALGRSHFVYNFEGTDDSWLTTGFANNSKIASSYLNQPAFYNINASGTMSVAKMLSAINKETNAYNQPRKLDILEIQPNEKFYYDPNNRDSWIKYYLDLFPWFIGTSTDITDDVTVTTMPTYEFIGKNEDVNENYDLVLIGNKKQDETNGKNGYNDPNLQIPIPTEAGGDGTTPSPVSYTAVGDLITTYGYTSYPVNQEYEAAIEDYDNPSNYDEWNWGYRWNTDKGEPKPDSSRSNYSYKWKYGLFKNNIWYNTRNASPLMGKSYNIGFARNFVKDVVGPGQEVLWSFFNEWTWIYQKTKNFVYGTKHGSDANMIGLRYSGNDITKKKYDQLLDFSTQAPLIVADDLYWAYPEWSEYANAYKLDHSSFVYKLAYMNSPEYPNSTVHKYANGVKVDKKANAVKSEMISDNLSATFTNTLNNAPGLPVEYKDNNSNNQIDSSGNNVLQYHFTLNGNDRSTYGINLYTDSNGNGIFEGCINHEKERAASGDNNKYESEKSTNLIIFDEYSKEFVTNGVLYNGHTYLVTRILPASDVGLIPWKLELYKQGSDSIRFSKVGYTRIPAQNRKEIQVLQMNPNANMSGTGYDELTICFANRYRYKLDTNWYGEKIPNRTAVSSTEMTNLYSETYVKDFNIQVDFMDNDYWTKVYGNDRDAWINELMKYDMLIIGFKDMAKFTNNENYIYAFEEFRKKGKSIILTHDLCEDATMGIMDDTDNYNTDKIIQSDVRYYLRDISGQLRKYYNAEADEAHKNDYSYLNYRSRGQDLTFEPSNYFNIYTFIRELKRPGLLGDYNIDYLMQNEEDKARTPIYNKYTYTYGVFAYDDKDDNWKYTYDKNQGIMLSSPINAIREYYDMKDGVLDGKWTNKPAGIIQDNSTRSMLYYSTINYDNDSNQFLDKLDRAVNLARTDLVWKTETFATYKVQAVNEGQITKYPYEIPQTLSVAQTHTQNYQLDLEYDDEGDVLIWYNLAGGGIYQGRNQDCRNDYYIYTKGNITYTGVGHKGGLTDDEKKLFVNTMVASYRSTASDPYVTVTNSDAVSNGKNTTLYLEQDTQATGTDIFFRVNDDTTNSKISRSYYIKISDGIIPLDSAGNPLPAVSRRSKNGVEEVWYVAEIGKDYHFRSASYSDIQSKNGEDTYTIELESTYTNVKGAEVTTNDYRNVSVNIMPMFGLR